MDLILILTIGMFILVCLLVYLTLKSSRSTGGGEDSGLHGALLELNQEVGSSGREQGQRLVALQQVLDTRLVNLTGQVADESRGRLEADRLARQELQATLTSRLNQMDQTLVELRLTMAAGLDQIRTENSKELERIRTEVGQRLQTSLADSLKENSTRIEMLTTSTGRRQEELRDTLREEMDKVRQHNESQLEKMRHTVDEKLQGTLEKRLGESFQLVSQRLEQVQHGLGEMRSLASDVGGLKRVLTNVKNRGTWGEVQLARQLEDQLAPSQYEENVAISPGSSERVEFAIKLPGRFDDTPVYLPIDSKFPLEPYERLLAEQECGDVQRVAAAAKDLEKALRTQAQTISSKYVLPPRSTDFAIMYLPTEGLFAEALRIPGLITELQSKTRIMVTGPTTLMSLLSSLQMGFKTLAIEKRSSEVWQVLGAAKEEFSKYGQVWEKLGKQLKTAQNTVEEAGRRTRAVERKLRDVETLQVDPVEAGAPSLLGLKDSMEE